MDKLQEKGTCAAVVQIELHSCHQQRYGTMSQVLKKASPAGAPLSCYDRVIVAISCCRLPVLLRALPNAGHIVVADPVRDTHQCRLLRNIDKRKLIRTATVSARLVSSDECNGGFTGVCKKLPHNKVSLAVVYLPPAKLYRALLDKKLCPGLPALRIRFFSRE